VCVGAFAFLVAASEWRVLSDTCHMQNPTDMYSVSRKPQLCCISLMQAHGHVMDVKQCRILHPSRGVPVCMPVSCSND
jgi:hypothetical protein